MAFRVAMIVAVLIALLLIFAATKPATLHVQRSIVINAPPEKVFALINNLHRWPDWEPQDDPTVMRAFSGPESGIGAASEWDSRGKAGKGKMLITDSQPSNRIAVKVDFVKPFHSHNLNTFTLTPSGSATNVTWSWEGQNLYFMKVMEIFMNMDQMMGKHFEDGLANMKNLAEK